MTTKKVELIPIEFPCLGNSFIHYFVTPDKKYARALMEKAHPGHGLPSLFHGSGLTFGVSGEDAIVWLQDKKPHRVAHEMIHAVLYMLDELGINSVDKKNEEIFAYLVDYAVQVVLKC